MKRYGWHKETGEPIEGPPGKGGPRHEVDVGCRVEYAGMKEKSPPRKPTPVKIRRRPRAPSWVVMAALAFAIWVLGLSLRHGLGLGV